MSEQKFYEVDVVIRARVLVAVEADEDGNSAMQWAGDEYEFADGDVTVENPKLIKETELESAKRHADRLINF